jgi:putative transcriptional regulator
VRRPAALVIIAAASLLLWAAPRSQADEATSLTGRLLVATPRLADPMFGRSVVYLLHHGGGGAFGLIVNQRVKEASFAQLFELMQLQHDPLPGTVAVHFGGPVEPRTGFVLHTSDVLLEEHEMVVGGIAATTDPRMLEKIAAGEPPGRYLFALGYAGWAPGQLEMEIGRGDWAIIDGDPDLIFAADPAATWERALAAARETTL